MASSWSVRRRGINDNSSGNGDRVWSSGNEQNLVHGLSTEFPRMPELNKRNERLTQAIEWWYQVLMLCVVLLFSIRHAATLYGLQRKIQTRKNGLGLKEQPAATSPDEQHRGQIGGEAEPLLTKPRRRVGIFKRIQAWSIRPCLDLPLLGRTCESNAQFYLVLFFYVGNIVLLFVGYPLNKETAYELGFRAGGLVISNLPWLFLMAAKNGPIKFMTGFSYESLNVLHRAQGYMICVLAMVHGAFTIYGHKMLEWVFGFTLKSFLSTDIFIIGQITLGLFIIILLTALPAFRTTNYEIFQGLHVFLQLAAMCLLYWHNSRTKLPAALCIAIYIWDRVVCRAWMRSETLLATIQASDDSQTCGVCIVAPSHHRRVYVSSFKRSISRGWKPGQHVFISIPAMGAAHTWQAHPFSISSNIPEYHDGNWRRPSEQLELLIRAHGGFSRKLHHFAATNQQVKVRIDGPYGSSLILRKLLAADSCLFIGGGTGIAVISPLAQASVVWHRNANDRTTHSLIWVRQEAQHLSWKPAQAALALEAEDMTVVFPPPTRPHGRPLLAALIEEMPNLQVARESKGKCKVCVVVSGPDQMVVETRRACARMLEEGLDVEVIVEKFGW